MAAVEVLEDDRDTSLPSSALSPAEYRTFRGLVNDLDRNVGVNNGQVSLYTVLDFLSSFNGVNQNVAQRVVEIVLGPEQGEFVGEGHIYAMIRLIGHWQIEGRIEKSMIFVQARVADRTKSKSSFELPSKPGIPPTSTTLNPFRVNSSTTSSSTITRTPEVDRGVEAFKRLMFSNNKEGSHSDTTTESEPRTLAPPINLEDSASFHSHRTDHSTTGVTFVYTSDEDEDEGVSSVKHSPETQLRESPQPILPPDRRSLPPLAIPQTSPLKPLPPPSRKRGASGSNQVVNSEERIKPEDKQPAGTKRNLPPAPPAPRRTLSSASTSHHHHINPERSTSLRRELPPQPSDPSSIKPPIPRPRRKLSDTSVTSVDILPRVPTENTDQTSKRLSAQAPPPPPPPRGRKQATEIPSSPTSRRSTDLPSRLATERPESPRRSSAPEGETTLQDSELSLELGRLQREVDELVYGLTKKRGGGKSIKE